MDVRSLVKQSLSDTDIHNFFDGKINILKFSELKNYNNIDDVLGKYRRCIILFESGKLNRGHWCAILEVKPSNKKNYILFFDSYGLMIESELSDRYIPKSFQKLSNQQRGSLIKLLLNQPLPVHYNQYKLQKLKKNVNTCGKFCVFRCLLNHLTEDEFAKLLRSQKPLSPDELVSIMYEDFAQ
jgi:hypothetical protein